MSWHSKDVDMQGTGISVIISLNIFFCFFGSFLLLFRMQVFKTFIPT